jgi:hypothetical protein
MGSPWFEQENHLTHGRANIKFPRSGFQSSSMVEQSAVNRSVVGSSPTFGANFSASSAAYFAGGREKWLKRQKKFGL